MGMLIRRHRDRHDAQAEAKPRRKRNRKAKDESTKVETPAAPASPYAELSDDEVAEAYATNVGEDAEGRDAQVAALEALDAEANPAE